MEKIKAMLKKILTREVILYVVFGVLTTLVSVVTFWLFNRLFAQLGWRGLLQFILPGKDYGYFDANIVSWVFAVLFAFFTNKLWVFASKSWAPKVAGREFTSFIGARLASLLVDQGLMFLLVSVFSLQETLSKVLVQGIIVIINYVFSKLFVFRKKDNN